MMFVENLNQRKMVNINTDRCVSCKFWDRLSPDDCRSKRKFKFQLVGICRRYPPTESRPGLLGQPVTRQARWCGEYKAGRKKITLGTLAKELKKKKCKFDITKRKLINE